MASFKEKKVGSIPVAGALTVFGSFLVLLNLGAFYTFGNIMPYLVSYMRNVTGEDITYSQFSNVNLAFGISNGVSMFLAPLVLVHIIGNRGIFILGTLCYVVGCFLTRWTLEMSVGMVALTYGFLQGLGNMALIPCYMVPMMWFPEHRGTVMGISIAGYGISSTIWSQLQLAITNPNNVKPVEEIEGGDAFFEDPAVLDQVPTLIFSLAGLYAIFLTIGLFLITEPDENKYERLKNAKSLTKVNYSKAFANFRRHVLTSPAFYLMLVFRLTYTFVIFTVPNYYKAFGLALGFDDAFITNYVGTLSGISQMTSRFIYGSLLDIVPFSLLVGVQSVALACFIGLLYTMSNLGRAPYAIWMHLIYLTFPGMYAIIPAKCRELFGEKYGGLVVGTLALSDVVLTLTTGTISNAILGQDPIVDDYLTYFLIVGAAPAIAVFAALVFPSTEENKQRAEKFRARIGL